MKRMYIECKMGVAGDMLMSALYGLLDDKEKFLKNMIQAGFPVDGGEIKGELCTPTGAALLKYWVKEFGDLPIMSIQQISYGMGTRNFNRPNCVRIFSE